METSMKIKASWIAVSLAAVAIAAPASAGEAPPETEGFFLCNNIRASTTATMYVSKLFEANADRALVYAAFREMLAAKYGVTDQVSCSMAYRGPGVQEKLARDNANWFQQVRAAGAKVVETGWAYGAQTMAASPAATPGAAPVASAAPAVTRKTYQCWISGFGGSYITPAFASSKDFRILNADWNAYMQKEHPSGRLLRAQCQEMDPKQAAANLAQPGRKRVDWSE
jgi:hypothetical protein